MNKKKYWDEFYKKEELIPKAPSKFCLDVVNELKKYDQIGSYKLIDLACGNGRDSSFFSEIFDDVTGVDISSNNINSKYKFINSNILDIEYNGYNVFYLRFVIHSLTEDELDLFINKFTKLNHKFLIYIETRSSKGVTDEDKSETNFKSSIGEEHYRMLYSEKYLSEKLSKNFKILNVIESNGLAIYKNDDPICIRYKLTNK